MKWQEVRELYTNKFVKIEVIESHMVEEKEYVDEVAVIKAIEDSKEAMREFVKCKNKEIIYSTKNKEFIIDVVKHISPIRLINC